MEAKNKVELSEEKEMRQDKEQEVGQLSTILDYEQSLFSVVRRAKRETRKWPRAALVSRVSRLRRSRARALLSLNLKKKRDCSQSSSILFQSLS